MKVSGLQCCFGSHCNVLTHCMNKIFSNKHNFSKYLILCILQGVLMRVTGLTPIKWFMFYRKNVYLWQKHCLTMRLINGYILLLRFLITHLFVILILLDYVIGTQRHRENLWILPHNHRNKHRCGCRVDIILLFVTRQWVFLPDSVNRDLMSSRSEACCPSEREYDQRFPFVSGLIFSSYNRSGILDKSHLKMFELFDKILSLSL